MKSRMSFISTLLLSLSIAIAVIQVSPSIAADQQPKVSKTFNVGVLYWSMNIEGQVAMRKGLEAESNKINKIAKQQGQPEITLLPHVAGDGVAGIENQINQMMTLIDDNVDLIIVQPTDIAALSPALKAANKAGIPVVAYDQHILGGELESFVTSDNYQAGFLNGEYVAAHFSDAQALRIILVEYPHVSSTVSRVDGFIDALDFYKQPYQIISSYSAVEPVAGAQAGSAILHDFPERHSIDVIFAVNGGGGLPIVEMLEDANRDEIFFAAIDGDPKSVQKIKAGNTIIKIDSAQFCGELGAVALRTSYKVLQGMPVNKEILVPVFPITKETVDLYQGWESPIPADFKKPWFSNNRYWSGQLFGDNPR
jgi:ribose transport system substrate-binding protein